MKTPAEKCRGAAPLAASVPGCFRKAGKWAWEAVLCGSPPRLRPCRAGVIAVAVLLLVPVSGAFGAMATLDLQNAATPSGDGSLTVPVVFSPPAGGAVAALQFDVEFDPAVLTSPASGAVSEGAVVKAAGKQLSFSKVSPGRLRVLVVGLNADVIAGGEIARLNFSLSSGPVSAASAVHVLNAVLADPNGAEVPVRTGGGEAGDNLVSGQDGVPATAHAFPLAALGLALGCLVLGGVAAGFARRRHGHGKSASENCRKRSPARCAAQRHG